MPLMKALKGRSGFNISTQSVKILRSRAAERLLILLKDSQVDAVVPAPSSNRLTIGLAEGLSKLLPSHPKVSNVLRKSTVTEVLESAAPVEEVRQADLPLYEEAVRKLRLVPGGHLVAVKAIHDRVRQYFKFVEPREPNLISDGMHLVVVDDSSASGATLGDSVRALEQAFRP